MNNCSLASLKKKEFAYFNDNTEEGGKRLSLHVVIVTMVVAF